MRRFAWLIVFFVVHWTVSEQVQKSCCGDQSPSVNAYTGRTELRPCDQWAALCYRTDDHPMTREFETREGAQAFIDHAPEGDAMTRFSNWVLEEVRL